MRNPDDAHLLLSVVLRLMKQVKGAFGSGLDGVSISITQYRLLDRLDGREATVSELADCSAVTLPTTTKILDGLVERGWVERWRSPTDRRQVLVALTEQGHAVLYSLRERAAACMQDDLNKLAPEELALTRQVLEFLSKVLDQEEATSCES